MILVFNFPSIYSQNLEKYFNISDPIFVIHRGNEGGEFFVNETSKELRVGAQGLDREEHDKYTLVMELFKDGKSKGFAMVRYVIIGVINLFAIN